MGGCGGGGYGWGWGGWVSGEIVHRVTETQVEAQSQKLVGGMSQLRQPVSFARGEPVLRC